MGAKAKTALKKNLKKRASQLALARRTDESSDFLPLEGGSGRNFPVAEKEPVKDTATVLYVGHIPHGFYEDQMEGFFKQFGTIKRLRIARNRKMNNRQKKGGGTLNPRMVQGTTLREENTGKRKVDSASMLKIEHLQKLATWAGGEANVPPLGALFGRQLASNAEAEGVALKTFLCERCESVLQPGFNCTIRIEKNMKKKRRRNKSHIPSQNNVVYKCHFCSHPNSMRGTQKGYVKDLLRSRPDANSNVQPSGKVISTPEKEICSLNKVVGNFKDGLDEKKFPELTCNIPGVDADAEQISVEKSPVTPLRKLLDSSKKKRKARPAHSTDDGIGSVTLNAGEIGGSSRRKRKGGWSSLKKISESNEAGSSRTISNFVIPLVLQVSK